MVKLAYAWCDKKAFSHAHTTESYLTKELVV